ncbi:hypothetical protein BG55_12830 [Erwinia mallotivora]|uniref:Uncharacterized protein n=1 Tax=Erwinia mallotivora TaxID=69222 RepID=A0A014N725_9GAMM|nr:hypothetical protein BG55_12830 [Erwinia mallotivora]
MGANIIKEMRAFINQMLVLDFIALLLLVFFAFKYNVDHDYYNYSAIILGVLFGVTIVSVIVHKVFIMPYFK